MKEKTKHDIQYHDGIKYHVLFLKLIQQECPFYILSRYKNYPNLIIPLI